MTLREYHKDRHEELKESGLCLDCGDVPVEYWESLCPGCKSQRRRHWKVYFCDPLVKLHRRRIGNER